MIKDDFDRLADLFQQEAQGLESRLGERISDVAREGRERGKATADAISELSRRMTAGETRAGLLEQDVRDMRRALDLTNRSSKSSIVEQDAIRVELDDVKASLLRMQGEPQQRNSKAPATIAAIGEAQQAAARSRWLPIALGVATAIGTMVNVLLHK